jgi:hypothetical protein
MGCKKCANGSEVYCVDCGRIRLKYYKINQIKQNILGIGSLDIKSAKLTQINYTTTETILEYRTLIRKDQPSENIPLGQLQGDNIDPWSFTLNKDEGLDNQYFQVPESSYIKECNCCNASGNISQRCNKCECGFVTKSQVVEVQKGCCNNLNCSRCKILF